MAPVNFSWVIPNLLAGSAMPGGHDPSPSGLWNDIEFLAGKGIRHLVSLERPGGAVKKICDALYIDWHHFPIVDFGVPSDADSFTNLVDECVRHLRENSPVCVHCRAGIGRTGLVLACITGKHLTLDAENAIAFVRQTRSAIEGAVQLAFIREFLSSPKKAS